MKNNLYIFNTLTNRKEIFKPIKGRNVNIFVCGPTVYDYSHIGHGKLFIIFDAFAKYLRHLGYNVFYLQNVTNIDDKIIARAREKDVSPKALADAFIKEYLKDMKALGIEVSKYAPATNYIKEIISQINRLARKGYAYKIDGDGIYFDISKFKNYGKLSGRTVLEAEDAVSRIDYSKNKKNRGDFCLWKIKQESSEPSWPSPWGDGRPGWHIEDTAIAEKFFGPQYDIHGGARELLFPHHEAEVAQMEAISGKSPMVKYWMHAGVLTVNGQKMAKSLGNFITISDFLKRSSAQSLRFFALKNLWSSPVDYSESSMIEVRSVIAKIDDFLRRLKAVKNAKGAQQVQTLIKKSKESFYEGLNDNFNTPQAFAAMFDLIKKCNEFLDENSISKKQAFEIYKFFEEINSIFEIIDFKKLNKKIPEQVKKLAKAREEFRLKNDWEQADQIRREIEKLGYIVEDTKDGPAIKTL